MSAQPPRNTYPIPKRDDLKRLAQHPETRLLMHEFYGLMEHDVLIGFFFSGFDMELIANRQLDFLSMAAGLTTEYRGKRPVNAHLQLAPILNGHFDRRLTLLDDLLAKHEFPNDLRKVWVAYENSFRAQIVAK